MSIPHSVFGIGAGAFADCELLEDAQVPSSVVELGEGAFRDCHHLPSDHPGLRVSPDQEKSDVEELEELQDPVEREDSNLGHRLFKRTKKGTGGSRMRVQGLDTGILCIPLCLVQNSRPSTTPDMLLVECFLRHGLLSCWERKGFDA